MFGAEIAMSSRRMARGRFAILAGDVVEEVAALDVEVETDGPASHLVIRGVGALQLPVAAAARAAWLSSGPVAGQDVELVAELADNRVADRATPPCSRSRPRCSWLSDAALGPFRSESVMYRSISAALSSRPVRRRQNAEFEDAGAFEHALQVRRVVQPALERPIAVVGGHDRSILALRSGNLRLELWQSARRGPRTWSQLQHVGDLVPG